MKPNELRMGNLVWLEGGELTILAEDILGMARWEVNAKEVTGIPLTAEWLERFGFVRMKNGSVFDHPAPAVPEDEHKDLGTRYPAFFFNGRPEVNKWMDCHTRVTVEYVHQLQNLYFALTGEELNLDGSKTT